MNTTLALYSYSYSWPLTNLGKFNGFFISCFRCVGGCLLLSVNRYGTVKIFSHALRVNWLRAWIGRSFMFAVSVVVIDTKARGNLNIEAIPPPKRVTSIWILCLMICFLWKLLVVQNKFGWDEWKLDAATLLILASKHLFSESRLKIKTPQDMWFCHFC